MLREVMMSPLSIGERLPAVASGAIASRYSSTACFLPAIVGCEPRLVLRRVHLNSKTSVAFSMSFANGSLPCARRKSHGSLPCGTLAMPISIRELSATPSAVCGFEARGVTIEKQDDFFGVSAEYAGMARGEACAESRDDVDDAELMRHNAIGVPLDDDAGIG